MSTGILGFGAYVDRGAALQRKAVVEAHGWFNSALKGQGKGERAIANWDEDAVTMAVEAARDASPADRSPRRGPARRLDHLPLPRPSERRHCGGGAEPRPGRCGGERCGGQTQRAGTTALIDALRARPRHVRGRLREACRTKAASPT
jgi:hydroxymethylglutaryl-CoA synthase